MSDIHYRNGSSHHETTQAVLRLFEARGGSRYGGEAISQLEHALQAAHFAEAEGASSTLITAALLHDLGHLLHKLPDDAPDQGIDDRHENLGATWLQSRFGSAVVDPVRLHVDAKRYLCTVEPEYLKSLSAPSLQSYRLQGGVMSATEKARFEQEPYYQQAVQLRRWDDAAKVVGLQTPNIEHFAGHIDAALADP